MPEEIRYTLILTEKDRSMLKGAITHWTDKQPYFFNEMMELLDKIKKLSGA